MTTRLDLLTHTVTAEIQSLIASGSLTYVELVKSCFAQIERHNYNGMDLRAVIDSTTLSQAIQEAQALDQERVTEGLRGPMHGIPVLVKVIALSRNRVF
jgi:amidase